MGGEAGYALNYGYETYLLLEWSLLLSMKCY